jgi:1-pyrroline-4-hydroxy-2-carboxylate deaminase
MKWRGVMPAMTTAFDSNLAVDLDKVAKRAQWMVDSGCSGVVLLGSLGESPALTAGEKQAILETVRTTLPRDLPVIAAVSGLSTAECVALAQTAQRAECNGLMVLPPYVYHGDWREMKAHVAAVFRATPLSCMLYNNPVAYRTDFVPEQIAELASEHPNFEAVKESSTDVRRVTAVRALLGDRLSVFVGVDDAIIEGVAAGATGWVAGLVNALPRESVELFNYAIAGKWGDAFELYHWFLPLLRLDTVPKFIQLIKLVEEQMVVGSARVRPPRLQLTGSELDSALQLIDRAIADRPALKFTSPV